jgi:hypothetical protein
MMPEPLLFGMWMRMALKWQRKRIKETRPAVLYVHASGGCFVATKK